MQARLASSLPSYDSTNLLKIADAIESTPGGRDLLQETLPKLADFLGAHPNFGHQVLAALLLEGAADVLTTNWDDCIERAVLSGERLQTVVHNTDYGVVLGPAVMKVHGCASRRDSLLVSKNDLCTNEPLWVGTSLAPHLAVNTIVFVGIGDVAEYVKVRIRALLHAAGTAPDIRVVSPDIVSGWADSQWATITEANLTEDKRIPASADAFLDDLLSAYVVDTLAELRQTISELSLTVPKSIDALPVVDAIGDLTALQATYWLRAARVKLEPGAAADNEPLRDAIIAAGMQVHGAPVLRPNGWLQVSDEVWLLAAADGSLVGPRLIDVVNRRLEQAQALAEIGSRDKVVVVYSGVRGPLAPRSPIVDIVEVPEPSDVISASPVRPRFVRATDVLEGAA
jgi:hypothetical protein